MAAHPVLPAAPVTTITSHLRAGAQARGHVCPGNRKLVSARLSHRQLSIQASAPNVACEAAIFSAVAWMPLNSLPRPSRLGSLLPSVGFRAGGKADCSLPGGGGELAPLHHRPGVRRLAHVICLTEAEILHGVVRWVVRSGSAVVSAFTP